LIQELCKTEFGVYFFATGFIELACRRDVISLTRFAALSTYAEKSKAKEFVPKKRGRSSGNKNKSIRVTRYVSENHCQKM
jgi:hypothetical protein